jgi:hypothetical protein
MILHAQPKHRVGIIAKCALILLAVVVLPLSAEAQFSGEPVKPDTARGQQTPKAPTQHRLPENTLQLTTAPVAIEGPTEKTVPVDPNSLSGSHPITGTPAVGPGASNSNDTEDRLARVEKLVQTILAEMHGQQQRHHVSVLGIKAGSSDATGGGVESVSLSDLKKQRIDLEDELESIKDRMDKVDAQIAKLQSARSSKLPSNDSFQVK